MRRIIITAVVLLTVVSSTFAAKMPKWVKNSRNAVCQIIAYNEEGNETGRTTGFIVSPDGAGISEYDIFSNAATAVAIDSKGVSHNISFLLGANRIYDVVRFKMETDKQMTSLKMSESSAQEGEILYMLPYSTEKSIQPVLFTIQKITGMAEDYTYYALSGNLMSDAAGCPLLNADGQVVGVIQSSIETDTCNYAIDSRFAESLAISSALTLNEDNYKGLTFPKALPDNEEQAQVFLFMNQGGDPGRYSKILDQFISQYPESPEGYIRKGTMLITSGDSARYDDGIALLDKAAAIAPQKDNALFEYARLIYATLTSQPVVRKEGWNLDNALGKINEAISINEVPAYLQLQGNILYSLERYADALDSYRKLNKTNIASPETYYYTSVIKGKMNVGADEIIATLDSAVNFYGRPYTSNVAPFILERATTKEGLERYRDAVLDLNEYEQIVGASKLSSEFYYYREQIEIKAKMYEQAIRDIEKAVLLAPDDMGLSLEQASLLLRMGMVAEATPIMKKLVTEYPDDTDCQRLMGICLMRSDNEAQAKVHLQKAKELGDDLADQLLKTIK